MSEKYLTVEYYAANKASLNASFKPVWIDPQDDKSILSFKKPHGRNVSSRVQPWTGFSIDPDFILPVKVELVSNSHRLSQSTIDQINNLPKRWLPDVM